MKVTRLIALLVAAFFVLLAPTAANAVPYPGDDGGVSATPPAPSGNGCYTTTVTVEGEPGDRLTLTVRNDDGKVVYQKSKNAGADGTATFKVRLCVPGDYTATGTNQDGDVLGTTQFTVPAGAQGGGNGNGNGSAPTSGSGNLPDTGADSGTLLTLVGALALLMVGGVTLVAAKRKAL